MTRFYRLVTLMIFCLFQASLGYSMQTDWEFSKEKNGIQVYTRNLDSSKPIEVKVQFRMEEVTICQLISVLKNVEGYCDWAFNCLDSYLLNQINEREAVEYYAFDFPWPMSNRDIITKSRIHVDDVTGKVVVENWALNSDLVPPKDRFVRMTEHKNRWTFTPVDKNSYDIEYYINTSPGGIIPNWIVNLGVDFGAYKTMDLFTQAIYESTHNVSHIQWLDPEPDSIRTDY